MTHAGAGETITSINVALVLRALLKMIVLAMTASPCALDATRSKRAIIAVGHGWDHKLVT